MSIPSLATLSVVIDPASRETGTSLSLLDAAHDLWRNWREAAKLRETLAQLEDYELRDIGLAYDEISLVRRRADFVPRSWSGDLR